MLKILYDIQAPCLQGSFSSVWNLRRLVKLEQKIKDEQWNIFKYIYSSGVLSKRACEYKIVTQTQQHMETGEIGYERSNIFK